MKKEIIGLLLFSLLLSSCSTKEEETNDTFNKAQVISDSTTVVGNISSKNDIDIYFIEAEEGKVLDVEVVDSDLQFLDIDIYDKNRSLIKNISIKENKKFENYKANGMFLTLKSITNMKYELKVKYKNAKDYEQENNNSLNEASKLELDHLINGQLVNEQLPDRDFFNFNSNKEEEKLSLSIQLSSINDVDLLINLYDISGNLITTFDSQGMGQGENVTNYVLSPPYDYYLELKSNDLSFNKIIPYELLAQLTDVSQNEEYEPNDNPMIAIPIDETVDEFQGYASKDDDDDYYKIEFKKGMYSMYNVFVTPPENLDVSLEIVDSFNNKIIDANSGLVGQVESIQSFHVMESVYFLHIHSIGEANKKPYKVKMYYRNYVTGQDKEPNETIGAGTKSKFGETMKGVLSSDKDIDFFNFEVPQKGNFVVEILFPKGVKAELNLYQETKKVINIKEDKVTSESFSQKVKNEKYDGNKVVFETNLQNKSYNIEIKYLEGSPLKNNEFYYVKIKEVTK